MTSPPTSGLMTQGMTPVGFPQKNGSKKGFEARPWTTQELARLRELAGNAPELIAEELGRTLSSVQMAAHRNRISLRRSGERRGLVLGQPRGTSYLDSRHAGAHVSAVGRSLWRANAGGGRKSRKALELHTLLRVERAQVKLPASRAGL